MKNRKPREKRASFYDAHFYNILDYFILAILVAGVLIFILYPLLCMVKQSFAGTEGFSTEVYKSIFSDNLVLVKNSVFVGNLSAFFFYDCRTSCSNLCVGSWKENGKSPGDNFID